MDRELLVSFIGLASFFLAMTMPLLLSAEWVTASWALQALVLVWIAGKLGSEFVRHVAYVLFAVVIGRFCAIDLPDHFLNAAPSANLTWQEYVQALITRIVMFGIPIGSLAGAQYLIGKQQAAEGHVVEPSNDIPAWIQGGWAMRLMILAVVATLFVYLNLELNRTVGFFYEPIKLPILTMLWLGLAAFLVYQFIQFGNETWLALAGAIVIATLVKLVYFDLNSWGINESFVYEGPYSFRDAGLRLIDFGAVAAFCAAAYAFLGGRAKAVSSRIFLGFTSLAMLFIYLTLEVNTFLHQYLPGMEAGGVSIVWSLFALALIFRGIARNIALVRYVGLALFAIVAWKVFFNDLAELDQFYRIVAFIILGILTIAGSFAYLKYRDKFTLEPAKPGKVL